MREVGYACKVCYAPTGGRPTLEASYLRGELGSTGTHMLSETQHGPKAAHESYL